MLPFRSLDPFRALREPDRRRRDEERLSRSEQRTGNKPKTRLDRKSPIQVRIHFAPAASLRTLSLSAGRYPSLAPCPQPQGARRQHTGRVANRPVAGGATMANGSLARL